MLSGLLVVIGLVLLSLESLVHVEPGNRNAWREETGGRVTRVKEKTEDNLKKVFDIHEEFFLIKIPPATLSKA